MFLKIKNFCKKLFLVLILIYVFFAIYGLVKLLPKGVNFSGTVFNVSSESVRFLSDKTYIDDSSSRKMDQQIFDEVFKMIDEAHSYILMDMFLFNGMLGTATSSYKSLSYDLTQKLITKKRQNPEIVIQVITDPINEIYGGITAIHLEELKDAGISVTITNLKVLRDSNPLYSGFWRAFFGWFPNSSEVGFLPNPFKQGGQKLGIRTYLSLFNFKANHRKVVLADKLESNNIKVSVLITSANPHDGSSAHSNTAIVVDEKLWRDVLQSEKLVVDFSNGNFVEPNFSNKKIFETVTSSLRVQLLTEKSIKKSILEEMSTLQSGDGLDMAMFYISDRDIVRAIKKADRRGVKIRLFFDPNKDAFGREKDGVPNRQVASEVLLKSNNTEVRWCLTHGEQCHSKLILFKRDAVGASLSDKTFNFRKSNHYSLIQGSANLTRRNLGNYNLETNVLVLGDKDEMVFKDAQKFFDEIWNNENGKIYSVGYEKYQDDRLMKRVQYLLMEYSGLSSF